MKKQIEQPSLQELKEELKRVKHRENYRRVLRSTFFSLVVVAAKKGFLENIELSNAGCIIQNMMVLAADRGIDSVYLWMAMVGINSSAEVQKKLGFPEGYSCVGTCALGYADKEFPKLKGEGQRLEVKILR